jgi:hypothetical protein
MSVDLDLWTRETGDLRDLLPRAGDWEDLGESFEFDGDAWLISVFAPEEEPGQVPAEPRALVEGLRYRIGMTVEPSVPDAEAWELVKEALAALGAALGGAAVDPESGRPTSWAT